MLPFDEKIHIVSTMPTARSCGLVDLSSLVDLDNSRYKSGIQSVTNVISMAISIIYTWIATSFQSLDAKLRVLQRLQAKRWLWMNACQTQRLLPTGQIDIGKNP